MHKAKRSALAIAAAAIAVTGIRPAWEYSAQAADQKVIRYIYRARPLVAARNRPEDRRGRGETRASTIRLSARPHGDIGKQVEMIENFVSQKVDVLAVASLGPATCQRFSSTTPLAMPASRSCKADGDYSGSSGSPVTARTIRPSAGTRPSSLPRQSRARGTRRSGVITGTPGSENLMEREQGFKDKVAELGLDVEFLPTIPSYERHAEGDRRHRDPGCALIRIDHRRVRHR